jgi:hypothetical protein
MIWDALDTLNTWVANHKELLTLIGVPLLTFLITTVVNRASERRASKERQLERDLARELKLSEYRQMWIDNLREELATLAAMLPARDPAMEVEANSKLASMLLRMNPNEGPSQKVYQDLMKLKGACEKSPPSFDDIDDKYLALLNSSNILLKAEWDRVKRDLSKASEYLDA